MKEQWKSKRRENKLHIYESDDIDSKELLRRLQGLRQFHESMEKSAQAKQENANAQDIIKLNILTDTLNKKNAMRKQSNKRLLDAEALRQQILSHEWYQQLHRGRDIINEAMTMVDCSYGSYLETEMNSRHLLEAVVMQRNALAMPIVAHRQSMAYPLLPEYILHPQTIATEKIAKKKGNNSEHILKILKDKKVLDYRETNEWKIYTQKDLKSNFKHRLFENKRSGIVQIGEPFDLRMKRSRKKIKKESW